MAEEIVPISPAIEAFGAVTGFLAKVPWARIWRVVSAPLAVPLAYLIDVLLVVFAPAIYIFQFFINSAQWTFSLLASLKPIYSFLSAAAGVGILAGVVVGVSSGLVTAYLGMRDGDASGKSEQERLSDAFEDALRRNSFTSTNFTADSSSDAELQQWAEATAAATLASPRRRLPPGLLSQTIHEEDDDSDGY